MLTRSDNCFRLVQVLRFYGLYQVEPGGTKFRWDVVVCALHACDKTVHGPKDLSVF